MTVFIANLEKYVSLKKDTQNAYVHQNVMLAKDSPEEHQFVEAMAALTKTSVD